MEEQKNIIEKQLIDGKSSDDSRQRKEVTQSNAKCDNDLVKILETKNPFVPHQEIINKLSAMVTFPIFTLDQTGYCVLLNIFYLICSCICRIMTEKHFKKFKEPAFVKVATLR